MMRYRPILTQRRACLTASFFLCAGVVTAQVVLDGKFSTAGPLAGPNFNITADLGKTIGNNLFHSFSQFNLAQGDVATFSGPANIRNVLSRITGNSPSTIDGTLQCTIAGANFFFMNPNGVVFGPHA